MSIEIGSAVSAGMAVVSALAALFAWWRSNLSKAAKTEAEAARDRAERQVQAAQEQAQAAQGSAKAAEEQVEHLQSLVAAQEAQGREVARIAEGLSPEQFSITHERGVTFVIKNNTLSDVEIERVVNADEFPGLRLETPLWLEGKHSQRFEYRMFASNKAAPPTMILDLTGADGPVAVDFPRKPPKAPKA